MAYFNPAKNLDNFEVFTGQTRKSMEYIAENGVNKLDIEHLRQLVRPLVRTANKRARELEEAGLTDTPAYRYYINEVGKFSAAKAGLNKLRHVATEAYKFLASKTSTVEGAKDFLTRTTEKWTGTATTSEQRKMIWDLYNRLEKMHPGYYMAGTYSSEELAQDIYMISEVLIDTNWDIDRALEYLESNFNENIEKELDGLSDNTIGVVSDWFERIYG